MDRKVQDILNKINFIEADIEIQKQILYSIPSNNKTEIERTLTTIAAQKEDINLLRKEIEKISPEEHKKIVLLENAVNTFRKMANGRKIKYVNVMEINKECFLLLKNGSQIPCLVKTCDEDGKWIVITREGEIKEFSPEEVDERLTNENDLAN